LELDHPALLRIFETDIRFSLAFETEADRTLCALDIEVLIFALAKTVFVHLDMVSLVTGR
jgi:hypothetical protein